MRPGRYEERPGARSEVARQPGGDALGRCAIATTSQGEGPRLPLRAARRARRAGPRKPAASKSAWPTATTSPALARGELRVEFDIPFVHCMPGSVGVGTTTPPGHMQKEKTPRASTLDPRVVGES